VWESIFGPLKASQLRRSRIWERPSPSENEKAGQDRCRPSETGDAVDSRTNGYAGYYAIEFCVSDFDEGDDSVLSSELVQKPDLQEAWRAGSTCWEIRCWGILRYRCCFSRTLCRSFEKPDYSVHANRPELSNRAADQTVDQTDRWTVRGEGSVDLYAASWQQVIWLG